MHGVEIDAATNCDDGWNCAVHINGRVAANGRVASARNRGAEFAAVIRYRESRRCVARLSRAGDVRKR